MNRDGNAKESPPKASREEIAALKEELMAKQETSRLSNELDAARENISPCENRQEEIKQFFLLEQGSGGRKVKVFAPSEETEKENKIGQNRHRRIRAARGEAELLLR